MIYVAFCISAFSEALERPNKESALANRKLSDKNGTRKMTFSHHEATIPSVQEFVPEKLPAPKKDGVRELVSLLVR